VRGHLHSAMATVPTPAPPEQATPEIDYVRWMMQLQTDLAETLGGVMLRGARPVQVGGAAGSTPRPTTAPGRLAGWSLRETSGTVAAVLRLYDGRDAAAPLVACISVPMSGTANHAWPGAGISLQEGLFVEIVSGAVEGAVYLGSSD
jgi:hypothetical protein